jgi:acyl-CoA thioester hydrolase
MNTVKKISVAGLQFVLFLFAPEFAFSQFLRRQLACRESMRLSEVVRPQLPSSETYLTEKIRMNDLVVTYHGAVYPWQCDHMGHMNVMWYVGKFDEASWQLLAQLGLTRSRFSKEGRGAVASEQHTEYRRELHAGDLITIRSRVLEVNEETLRITHEMTNDETGELAAVTVIVGLHIIHDVLLRKSCPFPSDVKERAVLMMAGVNDFNVTVSAVAQVEPAQQPGQLV